MIETKLHQDVLEIIIANAPVNALGSGVRNALSHAIEAAQADAQVKVILLRGAGRMFSGGADITEFDQPPAGCTLPARHRYDRGKFQAGRRGNSRDSPWRWPGDRTRMPFPFGHADGEAGTSPRCRSAFCLARAGRSACRGSSACRPRWIVIVSGSTVDASSALAMGLVDRLTDDEDFAAAAIAYARTVDGPRRTRDRIVLDDASAFERFAAANARRIQTLDAPKACIAAIKASVDLPSTRAWRLSANYSPSWSTAPSRKHCGMRFSPSARPAKSRTCRSTLLLGRSPGSGSSAQGRWAAASR